MSTSTLLYGVSLALVVGLLVFLSLDVSPAPAPGLGARGLARQRAREAGAFGPMELLLRLLAAHVSKLALHHTRALLDKRLVCAGEYCGLSPDEFLALSSLSALVGASAAALWMTSIGGFAMPLVCLLVGPFLPAMQLRSRIAQRCKSVDRALPIAIDLAALCMGAGLDFPGAIAHVVDNQPEGDTPLGQELRRVLQELDLGHTREQALRSLTARVPSDAVREFVAAVVQAEQKGTPISEVLSVQASVLRSRRSVLAEEAAARAGVMLMLPMLMMVVSIGLLLMGPLFIEMGQGEML